MGRKPWDCAGLSMKSWTRERYIEHFFSFVAHYKWNHPLVSWEKIHYLLTLFSNHALFWLLLVCSSMPLGNHGVAWPYLSYTDVIDFSKITLSCQWGRRDEEFLIAWLLWRERREGGSGGTLSHIVFYITQQLIDNSFKKIFIVLCARHCAMYLKIQWKISGNTVVNITLSQPSHGGGQVHISKWEIIMNCVKCWCGRTIEY